MTSSPVVGHRRRGRGVTADFRGHPAGRDAALWVVADRHGFIAFAGGVDADGSDCSGLSAVAPGDESRPDGGTAL